MLATIKASALVLGGGAAGCMAAAELGALLGPGRVVLIEKSERLLAKLLISGGGRCNLTHNCPNPQMLLEAYPRGNPFLRNAFAVFGQPETLAWFRHYGVRTHAESDGRMFPTTNRSETVAQALTQAMKQKGVAIYTGCNPLVHKINEGFEVVVENRALRFEAPTLLVATGGAPKVQTLDWLTVLGQTLVSPVPSIFTFQLKPHPLADLMGCSVKEVVISIEGSAFSAKGPILITHWGLSGPAVLRISAFAARYLHQMAYKASLRVNWLPHLSENDLKTQLLQEKNNSRGRLFRNLSPLLPSRLWLTLAEQSGIPVDRKVAEINNKTLMTFAAQLQGSTYTISGKTTYKEEFVTAGGIALDGIHPTSMESKVVPGLFFAGEVMDVDGITGGFNFQAAWSTGFLAAQSMARRIHNE
jgi:predicted Rossmann fold flavoprotein